MDGPDPTPEELEEWFAQMAQELGIIPEDTLDAEDAPGAAPKGCPDTNKN